MYCKAKKPGSREARNPRSWKAKNESQKPRIKNVTEISKIRSPEARTKQPKEDSKPARKAEKPRSQKNKKIRNKKKVIPKQCVNVKFLPAALANSCRWIKMAWNWNTRSRPSYIMHQTPGCSIGRGDDNTDNAGP